MQGGEYHRDSCCAVKREGSAAMRASPLAALYGFILSIGMAACAATVDYTAKPVPVPIVGAMPGWVTDDRDGTHTTKMVARVINEKLKLTKDGKAVNPRDGTFTLHEGGGERVLILRYPHGRGDYTPVK